MSNNGRSNGIALVAVLWSLLLLSLVGTGVLRETRSETNLTRNAIEAAKARALADAGVYRAVHALTRSEIEPGWRTDGVPYDWQFGGVNVQISVQDETGKIDLNRAPVRLLRGLFAAHGLEDDDAAALADAVADFRDEDDLHRLNGAEDDDYRTAGLTHEAKDALFDRVDELRQVLGMSPALFRRVEPALTVHSTSSRINALAAPRAALIGVPEADLGDIEEYLADRTAAETNIGTDVPPVPASFAASELISIARTGTIYTVRSDAHTAAGTRFVRQTVIRIRKSSKSGFIFEVWCQGRQFSDLAI